MDFLTPEEKEIIEKHEYEEQLKRSKENNIKNKEILKQNNEYYQSLYNDKMKEIETERDQIFENIISTFNFDFRNILTIEDQKILRIPISMMTENEKIKRKLIEDTSHNINEKKEFFNYNRYLNPDFKIDYYYYNLKGYFVNLKKVHIDMKLKLVDVFLNYNNVEYRIPLNNKESMVIIKIFESKNIKIQSYDLYPKISEIKNKIKN
jgi:hypothetical protein